MSTAVTFYFNGVVLTSPSEISIAAALGMNEEKVLRLTRFGQKPRGIFCGIGMCFDCVVTVDGIALQRACLVVIKEGMRIESNS
jgi:predicted molibdopterin-dependent oxidoreductase YjgC